MKKRFSGPQIVAKLRQADVLIGQGKLAHSAGSIPSTNSHHTPVSAIEGSEKSNPCFSLT